MKTGWSPDYFTSTLDKAQPRPYYFYLDRALRGGESFLEVGCGPGRLYDFLAPRKKLDYTAADLTPEMLALLRQRHPEVKTLEVDVQEMTGIPNDAYDWVVCSDVLIHIPKPYQALEHLWRVTRGALLFVVRGTDQPGDVVDINRSYQDTAPGQRFLYNIFNHAGMLERLRGLAPAPTAIDSMREDLPNLPQATRTIPVDRSLHSVWVTSYAVLKKPGSVQWLGSGDFHFSPDNVLHRLKRKLRKISGSPHRWDKV